MSAIERPAFPACCEFGDNFSIRSDLSGLASGRGAGSVRASCKKTAEGLRVTRIIPGLLRIPCRLLAIYYLADIFKLIV